MPNSAAFDHVDTIAREIDYDDPEYALLLGRFALRFERLAPVVEKTFWANNPISHGERSLLQLWPNHDRTWYVSSETFLNVNVTPEQDIVLTEMQSRSKIELDPIINASDPIHELLVTLAFDTAEALGVIHALHKLQRDLLTPMVAMTLRTT